MLAMTVAKPGAADKFRCQRRIFLKLVLRVSMLAPPGNTSGIKPSPEDFSSDGETWLTEDEEVLAEAAATVIGSPIAPRETRSRKRAEGKKSASSGPPSKSRPSVHLSISVGDKPVPMALSSKEERSRVTSFHGRISVP